jgi:hypothetical protein
MAALGFFIQYPWLAAVVGAGFFVMHRLATRPALLVAAIGWTLYAAYEYGMKLRLLCTGECNIRVDLLLLYPILLVVTLWALVALARREPARPYRSRK